MKLKLSLLSIDDAKALFEFETVNREFFEEFVPPRPDAYFIFAKFIDILDILLEEQKDKKSLFFLIKDENGEIIGRINMIDIDWITKTADVGYRVGKKYIGKGLAVQALEMLKSEALFLGIKRIYAKTTIDNIPSQKVLERCCFQKNSIEKDKFIHYTVAL